MSLTDVLQTLGDRLQSAATVKAVFGDPVVAGDRTVIPVARVRFGFGAGGGPHATGGGGGGGVQAEPVGIVEITPEGTVYQPFGDQRRLLGALLVGFTLGLLVARRKAPR